MPGDFNIPVPDVRLDPNEGKLPEPTNNNILGLATQAQQLKQLRNQNALFPLQQQGMQLENTGRALKNTQDQFTIQAGQRDRFNQIITQATAGLPADQVQGAAMSAVARAVDAGVLDQDFAARQLGQQQDWASLSRQAVLASGNENQMEAQFGKPETRDVGGTTNTVNVNRVAGTVTQMDGDAAAVAHTLTPGEKVARVTGVNPTSGAGISIPVGALATDTGEPREVPGAAGAGGVVQTSLPPGAAEGRGAVGKGSGEQYQSELAGQPQAQGDIAQMKQLQGLLETPEGQTGPGTQALNQWRDFAIAFLGKNAERIPGLNANTLQAATQDELRKYMARLASVNGAPYGGHTDFSLAQATTGNANPDMSNLANRDVTRMNLALMRANQARLAAFQATGLPPEQYSVWASNWARNVDPRAFMLDLLTPEERGKMMARITNAADKGRMTRGLKAAEAANLFTRHDIPGFGQ